MKTTNALLVACALVMSGLLLSVDYQKAFAFSAISYDTGGGGADGDYIIRVGDYIFICAINRNTVNVQEVGSEGTLDQTLTGLTTGCAGIVTWDGKVFTLDSTTTGTLREHALSGSTWFNTGRTVALGAGSTNCGISGDFHQPVTSDGFLYCARAGTTNDYVKVNLSTMAIVFTSTDLTVQDGCAGPDTVVPNRSTGYTYLFVMCTDRVNVYTDATNTLQHSLAFADPTFICVSQDETLARVLVTRGSTAPIYLNYTASAGFTTIDSALDVDGSATFCTYDGQGKRFTVHSANVITGYDLSDGSVLFAISSYYLAQSANVGRPMWWYYDDTDFPDGVLYGGGATQDLFYVYDMDGLPFGEGGGEDLPPDQTGGIDCSLPENEFILICRLANEGGSLNGTGAFLTDSIGNLICDLGIVDCDTNPDIRTNGIGYLFVAIALAVWVGLMWVAGRGDISSIPTFVWFIGTIVIVGAFTVMQYVDPTFLVISVIAVVGFAVAKARNVFGGNNGGFAGEG